MKESTNENPTSSKLSPGKAEPDSQRSFEAEQSTQRESNPPRSFIQQDRSTGSVLRTPTNGELLDTLQSFIHQKDYSKEVRNAFEIIRRVVESQNGDFDDKIVCVSERAILFALMLSAGPDREFVELASFLIEMSRQNAEAFHRHLRDELLTESRVDESRQYAGLSIGATKCLDHAEEIRKQAAPHDLLGIRHIVAAILSRDLGGGLQNKLKLKQAGIHVHEFIGEVDRSIASHHPQDDRQAWVEAFPPLQWDAYLAVAQGVGMDLRREASANERCLNVDKYANVLTSVYESADDGEFSLAIYGPWGRGKTYLMERVAEALPESYRIVKFSAWRYPSSPQVWIHLYETIAAAAWGGTWYERLLKTPNLIRSGISKHGILPIVVAYFTLLFSAIPFATRWEFGKQISAWVLPIFGLSGTVFLLWFLRNLYTTGKRLQGKYAMAVGHAEKLGLQATIGDDLLLLLKGWISPRPLSLPERISIGAAMITLFATVLIRLNVDSITVGVASFSSFLLWLVVSSSISKFLRATPKRLLLIVDDLDRCHPKHLLTVVESVKLLLEIPEVSSRVQSAILIEEDILHHAIRRKFRKLLDGSEYSKSEALVRENVEKLFNVHLRLSPISHKDLAEIIQKYSGPSDDGSDLVRSLLPHPSAENLLDAPKEPETKNLDPPSVEVENTTTTGITNRTSVLEAFKDDGRIISSGEARHILAALQDIPNLGPRSIRSFIFRYQLARAIAEELELSWTSQELITLLAEKRVNQFVPPVSKSEISLEDIAAQVS